MTFSPKLEKAILKYIWGIKKTLKRQTNPEEKKKD
jgi:hypothetical protein